MRVRVIVYFLFIFKIYVKLLYVNTEPNLEAKKIFFDLFKNYYQIKENIIFHIYQMNTKGFHIRKNIIVIDVSANHSTFYVIPSGIEACYVKINNLMYFSYFK